MSYVVPLLGALAVALAGAALNAWITAPHKEELNSEIQKVADIVPLVSLDRGPDGYVARVDPAWPKIKEPGAPSTACKALVSRLQLATHETLEIFDIEGDPLASCDGHP